MAPVGETPWQAGRAASMLCGGDVGYLRTVLEAIR
jgi:hypothetical protein